MEIIANSIQTPKPTHRFYAFIKDRVFIALVLAFSVLAVLDQSQAYQSLRFSLKSMLEIAPFFIMAKGNICAKNQFDLFKRLFIIHSCHRGTIG